MPKSNSPRPHGGARAGAGRPPLTKTRCCCGKHTMARAERLRLKCRAAWRLNGYLAK